MFRRERTENDELLIDNSKVALTIAFGTRLVKMMGSFKQLSGGIGYQLGPNLKQEFNTTKGPKPDYLAMQNRRRVLWRANESLLHLSVFCNWRFVDLNKAFRGLLHIYSSVSASTLIGNKIRDLLREIQYKRAGKRFSLLGTASYPVHTP